jgi:hypothetical protein
MKPNYWSGVYHAQQPAASNQEPMSEGHSDLLRLTRSDVEDRYFKYHWTLLCLIKLELSRAFNSSREAASA